MRVEGRKHEKEREKREDERHTAGQQEMHLTRWVSTVFSSTVWPGWASSPMSHRRYGKPVRHGFSKRDRLFSPLSSSRSSTFYAIYTAHSLITPRFSSSMLSYTPRSEELLVRELALWPYNRTRSVIFSLRHALPHTFSLSLSLFISFSLPHPLFFCYVLYIELLFFHFIFLGVTFGVIKS